MPRRSRRHSRCPRWPRTSPSPRWPSPPSGCPPARRSGPSRHGRHRGSAPAPRRRSLAWLGSRPWRSTAAQRTAYADDGVVVLRGLLDERWLELLATAVERNLAEPGEHAQRYTPEGQPGQYFGDYCNWDRIDEFRQVAFDSGLAGVARQLMGSEHLPLLPRARAGQGAGHPRGHAVAPRPALLLRRRRPERQLLDPARSRPGVVRRAVRGRLPPLGALVRPPPLRRPRPLQPRPTTASSSSLTWTPSWTATGSS